ncbi:MAG: TonB-dependent receptor plug domain-containing protein [Fulvivirga sp.]
MRSFFYSAILSLTFSQLHSQVDFRSELNRVAKAYSITFSYEDYIIDELFCEQMGLENLEADLKKLSKVSGFKFGNPKNGIVSIRPVERSYCLRLADEQTKEGVPGVQLSLDSIVTNNVSDIAGELHFNTKQSFLAVISLSSIGYEQKRIKIGDLSTKDCSAIVLEISTKTLDEVVVNYLSNGVNASFNEHSLQIDSKSLALLPGETDGDILLALKNLPGISSPNGKAGNLHVRGSTTDQTLVLFDDIPIYHKGHYFGAISPYNPLVIDQINVFRSGFGPEIGGRVGGAIDIHSSKTIPDSALYKVGVNSYYGSAFASVPISANLAIQGAIRTTYAPDWSSPKLDAINKMVFQPSTTSFAESDPNLEVTKDDFSFRDANMNVSWNLKKNSFFLSLMDINNNQDILILEGSGALQDRRYDLSNRGVNFKWQTQWKSNLSSKFSLTKSSYNYQSSVVVTPVNGPSEVQNNFENEIDDFIVKMVLEKNDITSTLKQMSFGCEVNRFETVDINRDADNSDDVSIKENATINSIYSRSKLSFGKRLLANIGARGNFYSGTDEFIFEPRVFVSYFMNDHLTFKSNMGFYSQYINQQIYFDFDDIRAENLIWRIANRDRLIVKSRQAMMGFIWEKQGLLIDIEAYTKRLRDLTTNNPRRSMQNPAMFVAGDLQVFGIDFLFKKSWGRLDTWVSYTYTNTEMDFDQLNTLNFITYYDQPHALNITSTVPWKKWSFSVGWSLSSGIPNYFGTDFFPDPGPLAPDSNSTGPVPTETNNGRFPEQHQLDLAAVYKIDSNRSWNATIGLSILNVYDRQNLIEMTNFSLGPNRSIEARYGVGFAPNLMLTISW